MKKFKAFQKAPKKGSQFTSTKAILRYKQENALLVAQNYHLSEAYTKQARADQLQIELLQAQVQQLSEQCASMIEDVDDADMIVTTDYAA